MSELYGPYASGAGANFSETQWREFFGALFVTFGVLKGAKVNGSAGNDLAVSAPGSGMTVNLATGNAIVNGFAYQNTATLAKTIAASDPSLPRKDRIIIRADFSGRTVQSAVLTGTPGASPSAPALTQTATTYEISLCTVAVAAAATVISSGNLTDERPFAAPNLNGYSIGHSSGQIPVSDGTVNTNLNADKTGGHSATHASGGLAINDGTLNVTLNADQVDGLDSTAFVQLDAANEAATPVKILITDVLPAAGTKGRIAFKTPFAMP